MSSRVRSPRIAAKNSSKSLANSPLCPGVGGGGGPAGGSVSTVPSSNLNSWNLCLGFPSRTLSVIHVKGLKHKWEHEVIGRRIADNGIWIENNAKFVNLTDQLGNEQSHTFAY